jgi:hypothetical protein
MSHWYIARADEFLIDLDRLDRRTEKGDVSYLELWRRRLRDAERDGHFDIRRSFIYPTFTPDHFHCYVQIGQEMRLSERLTWQSWLVSDRQRANADWMRASRGVKFPTLLEEPTALRRFYRAADYICGCEGKHKTANQPDCEVWREIRGRSPWELFGRPAEGPEREIPLPLNGEIPLHLIRKIALEYRHAPKKEKRGAGAGAGRVYLERRERERDAGASAIRTPDVEHPLDRNGSGGLGAHAGIDSGEIPQDPFGSPKTN